MKFKNGNVVYWKSPHHACGFVPNRDGSPREFVVLAPRRKYCTLRSVNNYKSGFTYQDLVEFDMSFLVFIRGSVTKVNKNE